MTQDNSKLDAAQAMFWGKTKDGELKWHWGPATSWWWDETGQTHQGPGDRKAYPIYTRKSDRGESTLEGKLKDLNNSYSGWMERGGDVVADYPWLTVPLAFTASQGLKHIYMAAADTDSVQEGTLGSFWNSLLGELAGWGVTASLKEMKNLWDWWSTTHSGKDQLEQINAIDKGVADMAGKLGANEEELATLNAFRGDLANMVKDTKRVMDATSAWNKEWNPKQWEKKREDVQNAARKFREHKEALVTLMNSEDFKRAISNASTKNQLDAMAHMRRDETRHL
ncbi:hypothetical protein [Vibrio coralliilyticus]|uniref:hypothetical protein n=1 Tax=Vibrio coralliilyticus TaxID=190893 RepID=UPI00148DC1E6|nr:hypothetical protein [Vibrio coralliilyticus]NOI28124.1 hypothetical protein [Vibrio coralliilyticus]NOI49065.1 hypothetical protein [Vibrio coralliilyticus]